MALTEKMTAYAESVREEVIQLVRDMCAIPAPSHHEEKRAEFCKNWFEKNGFKKNDNSEIEIDLEEFQDI